MKIVVANNKGGQGKTLLVVMIIQYLSGKGYPVTACDLDRTQINLTDLLQGIPGVEIFSRFEDIPDNGVCVVDTPPYLDDGLITVIQQADCLVVPVQLGRNAIQGVGRMREIRGDKETRYVINGYDDSYIQQQGKEYLKEQGYEICGVIPRYKRLSCNIDCMASWSDGFAQSQIDQIKMVLANITRGVKNG